MSHVFCVRHTYKKVAELFIKKDFWVFQITHVESCGRPAGGAVLLTAVTDQDNPFDQLFVSSTKISLLHDFQADRINTDMQESDK